MRDGNYLFISVSVEESYIKFESVEAIVKTNSRTKFFLEFYSSCLEGIALHFLLFDIDQTLGAQSAVHRVTLIIDSSALLTLNEACDLQRDMVVLCTFQFCRFLQKCGE